MQEYWNAGILECRNAGILKCRNAGMQECRNIGSRGKSGGRYLSITFRFHISDFRFQISCPQFLSSFLIC
jgi:hypothetical protein